MIIDAHTHIYPEKIAIKAAEGTGSFYGINMAHDGTVEKLLETGKQAGIDKFLVHSVATAPQQVIRINDFIAQSVAVNSEFIGFAAMHQDFPEMEKEIERVISLGLKGFKMHPDIQRFKVNDPALYKFYDSIQGRLPLLLHAGDSRYAFSNPRQVADVSERFPRLDIIAAHFGGFSEWDEAERCLAGRRIWVDTSSSLAFIGPERAERLIKAFGADRVLFGTDYPMWDASEELERFDKINLSQEDKIMILYRNISTLLHI